ncbi:hypothetical protein HQ576_17620, partial [bacterium]|nr:hypothetical protein [bacterium]
MTPRAIILGLLSAAAVCGFCYFNDFVMRQTFLVGNYMPISVYGGLLAFIIFVNPLLLKMSKRLALSGRELSVIVMLTLAACYVPGRGLCHYFTTFMMMPHHFERTNPGWKQHGIVEMAPPVMLAAAPPQYRPDDVTDPLAFYAKLTTEGPKPAPSPSRTVWQHLSEEARATARQALEAARADAERHATIAEALETVVRGWALQALDGFADLELPKRAKEMAEGPHDALSAEDKQWLGRVMFETAYPKTVATHKRDELAVTASDVLDWPAFCTRLQRQASRSGHNPGKLIWGMLPEQARQLVADTVAAAREAEQRTALLVAALNEIIA